MISRSTNLASCHEPEFSWPATPTATMTSRSCPGATSDGSGVILTPFVSDDAVTTDSNAMLTPTSTSNYIDPADQLTAEFQALTFAQKHQALAYAHRSATNQENSEATPRSLTPATIVNESSSQFQSSPTLQDWQALCRAVGVSEDSMPPSITQCKKTLKSYNANIADLTNAMQNGTVVATFPNISALFRYSRKEGKICAKCDVKKHKLLKVMLRELFTGDRKGRK